MDSLLLKNEENLESIIKNQLMIYKKIFNLEYYAIILFNPFNKQKNTYIHNNPEPYSSLFFSELMDYDYLMSHMMNAMAPSRLSDFSVISRDQSYYFHESQKLRPFGDCCYMPLFYDSTFTGFFGLVKPPGKENYSDDELIMLKSITTNFNKALNEKIIKDYNASLSQKNDMDVYVGNFFVNNERMHLTDISPEVCSVLKNLFHEKPAANGSLKIEKITDRGFYSFIANGGEYFSFEFAGFTYHIHKISKYSDKTRIDFHNFITGYSVYRNNSINMTFYLKERLNSVFLTDMEKIIVRHVLYGRNNREISLALRISPETVKKHLSNVYEKLGVKSRTQLVLKILS